MSAESISLGDRMARLCSHEVRELDESLDNIEGRLLRRPRLSVRHHLQRLGCRSWNFKSADQPVELVVDLGQVAEIDAIAMIPVHLVQESSTAGGYGFPKHFRLDISDHQDFDTSETVVDYSQTDCPKLGDYPFYSAFELRKCRCVRLSVLELSKALNTLIPYGSGFGENATGKSSDFLIQHGWTTDVPILVRGMALSENAIVVAGPPDVVDEEASFNSLNQAATQGALARQAESPSGLHGGRLALVDRDSSAIQSELTIDAPPVYDGLIVAEESVFVAGIDGTATCFAGAE